MMRLQCPCNACSEKRPDSSSQNEKINEHFGHGSKTFPEVRAKFLAIAFDCIRGNSHDDRRRDSDGGSDITEPTTVSANVSLSDYPAEEGSSGDGHVSQLFEFETPEETVNMDDHESVLYRAVINTITGRLYHLEPRFCGGTMRHVAYDAENKAAHEIYARPYKKEFIEGIKDSDGHFHPVIAMTYKSMAKGSGRGYLVGLFNVPNFLMPIRKCLEPAFMIQFVAVSPIDLPFSLMPIMSIYTETQIAIAKEEYNLGAEGVRPLNLNALQDKSVRLLEYAMKEHLKWLHGNEDGNQVLPFRQIDILHRPQTHLLECRTESEIIASQPRQFTHFQPPPAHQHKPNPPPLDSVTAPQHAGYALRYPNHFIRRPGKDDDPLYFIFSFMKTRKYHSRVRLYEEFKHLCCDPRDLSIMAALYISPFIQMYTASLPVHLPQVSFLKDEPPGGCKVENSSSFWDNFAMIMEEPRELLPLFRVSKWDLWPIDSLLGNHRVTLGELWERANLRRAMSSDQDGNQEVPEGHVSQRSHDSNGENGAEFDVQNPSPAVDENENGSAHVNLDLEDLEAEEDEYDLNSESEESESDDGSGSNLESDDEYTLSVHSSDEDSESYLNCRILRLEGAAEFMEDEIRNDERYNVLDQSGSPVDQTDSEREDETPNYLDETHNEEAEMNHRSRKRNFLSEPNDDDFGDNGRSEIQSDLDDSPPPRPKRTKLQVNAEVNEDNGDGHFIPSTTGEDINEDYNYNDETDVDEPLFQHDMKAIPQSNMETNVEVYEDDEDDSLVQNSTDISDEEIIEDNGDVQNNMDANVDVLEDHGNIYFGQVNVEKVEDIGPLFKSNIDVEKVFEGNVNVESNAEKVLDEHGDGPLVQGNVGTNVVNVEDSGDDPSAQDNLETNVEKVVDENGDDPLVQSDVETNVEKVVEDNGDDPLVQWNVETDFKVIESCKDDSLVQANAEPDVQKVIENGIDPLVQGDVESDIEEVEDNEDGSLVLADMKTNVEGLVENNENGHLVEGYVETDVVSCEVLDNVEIYAQKVQDSENSVLVLDNEETDTEVVEDIGNVPLQNDAGKVESHDQTYYDDDEEECDKDNEYMVDYEESNDTTGMAVGGPEGQNQWIAIAQDVSVSTSAIVPSQQEDWGDEVDGGDLCGSAADTPTNADFDKFRSLDFQLRFENLFTTSPDSMPSPLPQFNWANSKDVWRNMVKKETTFQRDPGMFRNHPELQPRMRSILLDWLSEVCEVYRLHKETFTLCVDFIDRYLSVTRDVAKTQLQLTGISALFIAAKLEEIYPPKLSEFAYVTDSACSETDIIRQEMIMLKALKWDLSPMTTNAWLGIYLQMANVDHIKDADFGFVFPQFSSHAFIQISRLCDLCLMDSGSLKFRYSVIAAAAMYHHTNEQLVMEVSSFNWADLYPCVKWMAPFAKAILEVGQSPIKFFPHVSAEDCHNIQTHNVDMPLVDRAQILQAAFLEKEKLCPSSLDLSAQLVCLLTPQPFMKPSCDNTSEDEHRS